MVKLNKIFSDPKKGPPPPGPDLFSHFFFDFEKINTIQLQIKCKLQIYNFFTRTFLVCLICCNLYFIGVTNRTHLSNHSCTGLVFPNLSVVYLAFLRWRTGSTIFKFTSSSSTMLSLTCSYWASPTKFGRLVYLIILSIFAKKNPPLPHCSYCCHRPHPPPPPLASPMHCCTG